MLEKSGSIVLTSDDLEQYNHGIVSDRVQQTWGLSLDQLRDVVENKQFTRAKE